MCRILGVKTNMPGWPLPACHPVRLHRLPRHPRMVRFCTMVLLACCCASAVGQQPAVAWKYDLAVGDNLTYAEVFQRRIDGPERKYETRLTFINHVLVLSESTGQLAVGVQRNRQSAELVSYRERGKDKLTEERPQFAERMSKISPQFSEANLFSQTGTAQLPWAAVREATSRVLFGVHEIESLPETPVQPGDQWTGRNTLGLRYQFVRTEGTGDEQCAVVEGAIPNGTVHMRYWFCPHKGAISRLEFTASYAAPAGDIHESVVLELKEKRRGEQLAQWLSSPDDQLGALRCILVAPSAAIQPQELSPVFAAGAAAQALALAILYRRSLAAPDAELLSKLAQDRDPRVARLAAKLAGSKPPPASSCSPPRNRAVPLGANVQTPGTTLRFMQRGAYRGYPYVLHLPEDYRNDTPMPMIVYLTGGPGLAVDGANTAEETIATTDYIVVYPHAGGEMWWTPGEVSKVRALLDELSDSLNIDPTRVYMTGFSNGGTGALYYATLWPEQFAAVVSLMGAGNCMEEIQPLALAKLKQLPVLFVHGDKDPVIAARCSQDTYKQVRKYSPASVLKILKDHEHDITLGNDDGLTLQFIRQYSRCGPVETGKQ